MINDTTQDRTGVTDPQASEEALEVHARLLVALKQGDHPAALEAMARLRSIYLELWESELVASPATDARNPRRR